MSEALTEQNLALWESCELVLLAMDGKPPNVFHDVRGLNSATMNRLLDAARAEGSANLSKVMEENARLTARVKELEEGLAQIERMRLFPDDKINRTTLQAAIHIARSLLSREG